MILLPEKLMTLGIISMETSSISNRIVILIMNPVTSPSAGLNNRRLTIEDSRINVMLIKVFETNRT